MEKKDIDIRKFKRELLYYIAYLDGFGYLRWSKRKHKVRIAVNKRTYRIINSKLKIFVNLPS